MITCIPLKRQKCANITVQSNVRSFFPWRASVPVSSVSTSSDSTYLVSEDLSNTSPNTSTTLTSTVPTKTLTSISLNTFFSVASVDYSTSVTNASSHLSCHFPDCHWYSATGQHLEPSSTCGSLFNSSISPSIIHHRRITFGSYLTSPLPHPALHHHIIPVILLTSMFLQIEPPQENILFHKLIAA